MSVSLPKHVNVTVVSSSTSRCHRRPPEASLTAFTVIVNRRGVAVSGVIADLVGEAVGPDEVGVRGVVDRTRRGSPLVDPVTRTGVTVTLSSGRGRRRRPCRCRGRRPSPPVSSSIESASSTASGPSLTEFTVMSTVAVSHCRPGVAWFADLVAETVGSEEVGVRGVVDATHPRLTDVDPFDGPDVTFTELGSRPSSMSVSLPNTSTVTDWSPHRPSRHHQQHPAGHSELLTVMNHRRRRHSTRQGSHTW